MPLELLHGIRLLHEKGYEAQAICRKTGLSLEYVNTLLMLIILGEDRLMAAVQKGSIPINAARDIVSAGNDDKALQGVLQDAYESGQLRGRPLFEVRRLLQLRENLGKSLARKKPPKAQQCHHCKSGQNVPEGGGTPTHGRSKGLVDSAASAADRERHAPTHRRRPLCHVAACRRPGHDAQLPGRANPPGGE